MRLFRPGQGLGIALRSLRKISGGVWRGVRGIRLGHSCCSDEFTGELLGKVILLLVN